LAQSRSSRRSEHDLPRPDVVHVLPHAYPLGGAERSVLDLLESPLLDDLDQRIVFLRGGFLGPFPAQLVLASGASRAAWAIVSARPRILQGCLLRGNAFAAAISAVLLDTAVFTNEQNLGHNLTPTKRLVERFVAAREDLCIANSRAVADAAVDRIPGRRERIRVIQPGIPPPNRAGRRRAASCVAVGRLEWVKDHETLLRAWPLVRKSHSQATLVVVGDGPDRQRLERLIADLDLAGSVSLAGAGDPFPFLRGSVVYASTARAEGFSRAMLEALALGLPIVATAVGGARELPREAVRLVPVGDVEATANAIVAFLNSRAARVRATAAGRAVYARRFTSERCHSAYRDLYLAWLR
jgi:glycosyltransferase involved in cell wall biosynthesis